MKIVTFEKPLELEMGYWGYRYFLAPGLPFIFLNHEVTKLDARVGRFQTRPLDDTPRPYAGEDLARRSLLFISLGGYGDVLCFLQALNALQTRFPDADIDVCTHMDLYWLMKQFGFKGGWLSYPTKLPYLNRYDYYQTSDGIDIRGEAGKANITSLFHDLLKVERNPSASSLTLDQGALQAMQLPAASRKRIAIQVDAGTGVHKRYPEALIYRLSERLGEAGVDVYLVGSGVRPDTGNRENLHDYTDRTATIVEFVALLSQMDLIIAPDSVGAHIGGILQTPTIALFSVTSDHNLAHYTSVTTLASQAVCAPCMSLQKCPSGYDSCVAFDDVSVSPERVSETALEMLGESHEKGATEK